MVIDITLPGINALEDVLGDLSGVKITMAGNQWFAARDVLRILNSSGIKAVMETIPPGLARRRVLGEAMRIGGLVLDYRPEIASLPPSMLAGIEVIDSFEYVENDVVIAYTGKPVLTWCGLRDRRAAIPNPITEGIGAMFAKAFHENCGGYDELLAEGAFLTKIHHREIPALINAGIIDAGIVWRTEAIYWGLNYSAPEPRLVGRLAMALMPWASGNAGLAYSMLKSNSVKEAYEKYGFRWVGPTT